jgi:hypothetical protein
MEILSNASLHECLAPNKKRPGVAVRRAFVADVVKCYPKISLRRSPTNPNRPNPKSMLVEGSGVEVGGLPVSNMAPLFAVAPMSPSSVAMNPTIYEANGSVPELRLNVGPDDVVTVASPSR